MESYKNTSIRKTTWQKILNFIASTDKKTPYLLLDREVISDAAKKIGKGIKNSKTFYAVKAHPGKEVISFIEQTGVGFEVASEGELAILKGLAVAPERIISSNPVKTIPFLEEAGSYRVRLFAFDSIDEIEKIHAIIPDASLYLRLSVPNEGSEWPLSRKFGVEPDVALDLIRYASERGMSVVGTTFHVGSQCNNIYNWQTALDKVSNIWSEAEKTGVQMRILNIGGGYPVKYRKDVPHINEIESLIDGIIRDRFPSDIEVHIEPGRAFVGEAGVFVTTVIGKAVRGDENWLYIDAGVFNGLMEAIGGIKYSYILGSRSEKKRWTIAGPSCDSLDVIDQDVLLPEPMVGDHLIIASAGAYTISYASEFNGFPIPETILI
ncbi:MAG: type III PLP-dependent enzyme [Nitrospirae bacterium]|nr:MAG: type III PLP-dependent enzyme [Nitrospirota bacterium]